MDQWYLANASVQRNKEYYMRMWLTLVPSLEHVTHEYYVGLKPHEKSLAAAVADGSFSLLDPWFDNSWGYRKNCLIYQTSGAGPGYQILVRVHRGTGTDSGVDVYVAPGKCRYDFGQLLYYWLESVSGDTATFWVKIAEDLSSGNRAINVYYGNSGATTTSNGVATFDFFDDFSSSPNGWTMSGCSISSGYLYVPAGSGAWSYAQKARPNGYDNYRFCFKENSYSMNNSWRAYPRGRGIYDSYPTFVLRDYYYNPLNLAVWFTQGSQVTSNLAPARDTSAHVIELLKVGYSYTAKWDSLTPRTVYDATAETGTYIAFSGEPYFDGGAFVDWCFLAKYTSPEPSRLWGIEEESLKASLLWGTLWYDSSSGEEPEERNKSGNVTEWIYDLFNNSGEYENCHNYWGSDTTATSFYGNVSDCDTNYAYTTVFYKGHTWNGSDVLNDGHNHYSIFSYNSTSTRIIDNYIYQNMSHFTHGFVFLWTCMLANEIGDIPAPDHSWGMPASWMGTIDLTSDGYTETNDYTDRCFISFMNISMPFRNWTGYDGAQYAHFVYQFYSYGLNYGYSVKEALDAASLFACNNALFSDTSLYQGYNMTAPQDPNQPWRICKMRVIGDGDHIIPG
jgi:hypothetical protein